MKLAKLSIVLPFGLVLFSSKKKTASYDDTTKTKKIVTKATNKKTANKTSATTTSSQGDKEYRRVGNTIYFGTYPQSLVTDTSISEPLIEQANSSETGSWINVNVYASNSTYNSMRYKDIAYNDEKYRVVYLMNYINYSATEPFDETNYPYQQINGYETNTKYCFKYEDVKWDILEEKDGKATLLSSLMIDATYYEKISKNTKFIHNGDNGYSNNYYLSDVRKWLINTFYETTFNDLQKEIIENTLVYNHKDSTGNLDNRFTCYNTEDKVFLLSVQEINKYFPNENDLKYVDGMASDYAKCFNCATDEGWGVYWITRSPHDFGTDSYFGFTIEVVNGDNGSITWSFVDHQYYGIRPAITIKL